MGGTQVNELWAEAQGPTAIPPFALYGANQPDALWSGSEDEIR